MFKLTLTSEQRESFNEAANRKVDVERVRQLFDQDKWMTDGEQVFILSVNTTRLFATMFIRHCM